MAFVHGKNTKVLVGEFDLTGYFDSASATFTRTVTPTTVFGLDDHTYVTGQGSGSLTLGGLWDNGVNGSDALLNTALDGAQDVVSASPQGMSAIGQRAVLLNPRQSAYNWSAPISDVVRIDSERSADGGIRGGVVLHELAAETSTGNFTSVDNGASSAFGSVGHLHVTAFSGTSATIKITDSTDDAVFADLITFASVTAAGSERATAAGTVNRYARVELSGTFTSVTFAVLFARHLQ